jgi:hypothetical protein
MPITTPDFIVPTPSDYWQGPQAIILLLCATLHILITVQAPNPKLLLLGFLLNITSSSLTVKLQKVGAIPNSLYIVIRFGTLWTHLASYVYMCGKEAPGWLFGLLAISMGTLLKRDMMSESKHIVATTNKLPMNWTMLCICLAQSVFVTVCCYVFTGDATTVTSCFVTLTIFSYLMNYGVALVVQTQHIAQLVIDNQKLEREMAVAQQDSEHKSMFIAKVSHELRTPLHAVVCCCDLMAATILSPEQIGFVKVIEKSSNLLLQLINNILDISKSEAGKFTLENRRFNIQECLNNVVATMRTKLVNKKKPKICLNVDSSLPQYIIGDETRLTQVVRFMFT